MAIPSDFYDEGTAPAELRGEVGYLLHDVGDREYEYTLNDALVDIMDNDELDKILDRPSRNYLRTLWIKAGLFGVLDTEKLKDDILNGFAPVTPNGRSSVTSLTLFRMNGKRYTSDQDYFVN